MNWSQRGPVPPDGAERRSWGAGVFRRCGGCGETVLCESPEARWGVCPHCGHHERIAAEQWVSLLTDAGSFAALDDELRPRDPLGFTDGRSYSDRVALAARKTGQGEAVLTGRCAIDGRAALLGVFVFGFLGGSMGSVVGERLTRLFERGAAERVPVVVLSSSGGARMQEGVLSLMQMARTVAARERLRAAGVPFISVLLDPTTGGVAASYALLGDVNVAEPKALIGFAGPRVIEQTIRQTLPEGFQRSEFLLAHGMIDAIVERGRMRETLAKLLGLLW